MIVDLFAGPGGWDVALGELGREAVGIENDGETCRTRQAAGLLTIQADVSSYPIEHLRGRVEGLIASPPCQDFSNVNSKRGGVSSARGQLVYEVLRWTRAIGPRWIACEQVREVLPIWRLFQTELEALGYRTWTGVLDAADFGVPQNRVRAILLASRDRSVYPPPPTHCEKESGYLLGEKRRAPWVSMSKALGWTEPFELDTTVHRGAGNKERHGDRPNFIATRPAPTVISKARSWRWVRTNNRTGLGRDRDRSSGLYYERSTDRPAPTLTGVVRSWTWIDGAERRSVEVEEALRLQGFPDAFVVSGSRSSAFEQIGNAIPPPLAKAVLAQVIG